MQSVNTAQEIVQAIVAVSLVAAYVALSIARRSVDHFDIGVIAVIGVYFGGKVAQGATGAARDVVQQVNDRGRRVTDPPPGGPGQGS